MKMKKIKIITFVLLGNIVSQLSNAQQQGVFNTYNYDLMQINVAAMGRAYFDANFNYRAQSTKIGGVPQLYQLNTSLALGEKQAVGLKVYQFSAGLLKFNTLTGAYGYKLKLNNDYKISFALGVSYMQTIFDAPNAIVSDQKDQTLINDGSSLRANNFDSEFGALFYGKGLTLGLSVNHLYNTNGSAGNATFKQLQEFNLVASYLVKLTNDFELTPWLLTRYTLGSTFTPEIMMNARYKKMFTAGGGYRYPSALIANMGAEIGGIKVIYSFDYRIQKVSQMFGSSHQIMLGFKIGEKK
ncbi:MAG: PorP/SprF family type IX secretion system membrane protein [Bacteroidia bacterium]|nr:PorP/SprF family type IX secretion system membrane protein [Bacteroidia bacterium]